VPFASSSLGAVVVEAVLLLLLPDRVLSDVAVAAALQPSSFLTRQQSVV